MSVVDAQGVELERFGVEHTAAGLLRLTDRLGRAGVVEVGIERPDGPVVDALLAAALTVFVIAPNRLESLRGRYGSAGNKDDRFDAFVLADTVRTDRALVRALTALREQIRDLDEDIAVQLAEHPDAKVFTSLPRSGTVRPARLLAEIGDARGRFPLRKR